MKKQIFKKLMSATLALVMILSVMTMLPISAFADNTVAKAKLVPYDEPDAPELSGTCGENVAWSMDRASGTLTISGTGNIVFDNDVAPWYAWRFEIEHVVIERGVTDIPAYAFANLSYLETAVIPYTITSIGDYAFHTSYMQKITFCGMESEWDAVTKGMAWKPNTASVTRHDYMPVAVGDKWHQDTCRICGHTKIAVPHIFDEGTVLTEPTHTSKGEMGFVCTECYYPFIEDIDPLPGHSHSVWEKHDDIKHKQSCVCGDIIYADHEWNEGVTSVRVVGGKTMLVCTYTCTVCSAKKTDIVDPSDTPNTDNSNNNNGTPSGTPNDTTNDPTNDTTNDTANGSTNDSVVNDTTAPSDTAASSNPDGNTPETLPPLPGGCGSAIVSTWSVLVLVALLPLIFFRKKKENE